MTEKLNNLSDNQQQIIKDAIAWITVLIAGADGNVDAEEMDWAQKLTKIRSYNTPVDLNEYYASVGEEFTDKVNSILVSAPIKTAERTALLTNNLSQLNEILPLIESPFNHMLYKSYVSFAKHVAKSSGGFLGFLSVSKEESSLMDLPMITPIAQPTVS